MCQNVAESGTNMCQNMCLKKALPDYHREGFFYPSINHPAKSPNRNTSTASDPNSPLYKGRCTPDNESSFRITAPGSAPCLSLQSHVSDDRPTRPVYAFTISGTSSAATNSSYLLRFIRPRTFRIVRPFPREALLLRQIAECLPVRQQCGIVFPGYRSFDIPCGLFLVPFDKPCRRVKAAVTLGTDACGAGPAIMRTSRSSCSTARRTT